MPSHPFYNRLWNHLKQNYGGCIGWTAKFPHRSAPAVPISARPNLSDSHSRPKQQSAIALCLFVEFASQGTNYSPMVPDIYRQETFPNMCVYDFFNRTTGYAAEAAIWYNTLMSTVQSSIPPGAVHVNWFKNWYLPLFEEHGNSLSVQSTYYGLLSRYFPTSVDGMGMAGYVRRATVGEYIHFMSAAVGRNLEGTATVLFNTGWKPEQLIATRIAFSVLNSMYPDP
ncbi:hypothetical protein DFS34DRAFT_605575 [Phlyctochytrium arcticum]|nr:hypothetical protein DFS34DRAFT_605575 [Phlyctochytrium arcticum]